VIWIHGGGLIFGSRKVSPRDSLVRALLARDLVVVSIDHRLAPEAKLPAIVQDVRDAWRWVHESGPVVLGIASDRIAIAGASAGAYLSLMAGYMFEPRPRAVASFFGFGDITAPWEADPSPYYRTADLLTREKALASLTAPPVQDPAAGVDRSSFYLYCRQQGLWLPEVTAHDPGQDPGWFDPYCPVRNITKTYPPTMLVHGTQDNDVPHDESAKLAEKLATSGVEHQFISLPGVGHGFAGARPEDVDKVEAAVAEFLRAKTG
jgi:acetyl esterase/lipase